MRWLWLALLLGGCAASAAPAPVYLCAATKDSDGDSVLICEPHFPKSWKSIYGPRDQRLEPEPQQHRDTPLDPPRT